MHIKKVQDWARNHQVKGAKLGKIRQKKVQDWAIILHGKRCQIGQKFTFKKGAKLDK